MPEPPQINWAPSTLPSARRWQNNQFFCIITELTKAGSYQDTIPVLQLLAQLAPCSNQRAGTNYYTLNCTESSWSFRLVKMSYACQQRQIFSEHENFCKTLETCFLSQLLWKLRLSKVLPKPHLMMKYFTFNSW